MFTGLVRGAELHGRPGRVYHRTISYSYRADKVGLPGADIGLRAEDPSIAEFLKPLGYATGQFGKNHLGDKDEFLPTNHGFDEFFGNLYHLNAEEEPENPDYPKSPDFAKRFRTTPEVIKASADGRSGRRAADRQEDGDGGSGIPRAAMDFIDRKQKVDQPWFCYFNPTRMHVFTHLKPESQNKTGLGLYADGMVELDGYVGQLLQKLEDLGVAGNTIVVFTTDNGAEVMSWPDGGNTPFRGEEGNQLGGRLSRSDADPLAGNDQARHGLQRSLFALRSDPDIRGRRRRPDVVEKCLKGGTFGTKTFKVHLDGYNLIPFFKGEVRMRLGREFIYWNDDGQLVAIRYDVEKPFSWSRTTKASASGCVALKSCACPSCSTSDPIRSNGATSRSSMTDCSPSMPSSRFPRRRSRPRGLSTFENSRQGGNPPASISTRSSRSCPLPPSMSRVCLFRCAKSV